MYRGTFKKGTSVDYHKKLKENGIYLYLIEGEAKSEDQVLKYRDGLGIIDKDSTTITFESDTDIFIIDVPMKF